MFLVGVFALTANASVKVNKDLSGKVIIEVTGEAGQIGKESSSSTYDYAAGISSDAQALIKSARDLIVKGNVNSADIKTLVAKNKNGNDWTLNSLDLGGATIDKIAVEGNEWYASSHTFMPDGNSRIACKKMVLPVTRDGILPNYFRACFGPSGTPAIETLVFPEGYKSIGASSFKKLSNLSSVVLPNSLESIGDNAFEECKSLKVIVFPAGFKTLGDYVFVNTKLTDVYFLGKEAPVVGAEAFDPASYNGNNSFKPTTSDYPIGNTAKGYAERRNYMDPTGANTFAVMHLRADLTNEERAKYTDITRKYEVVQDSNGSGFWHAFKDLYYGDMKIWPGSYSYQHTYNDAVAGKLWDGVTTYDKDKYMGLHKFSLTVSNIHITDTKKWTFDRISADQWWTICVPFKMTKRQVKEVFGDAVEICKFNKVERDMNKKSITLFFNNDVCKSATNDEDIVIQDNISYMIFPTKQLIAGEKYTFEGYQLEPGSPEPTMVKATFIPASSGDAEYTYRFIGTYLSTWSPSGTGVGKPIYMPRYCYFLGKKGDKHQFFYQVGTTGTWNAYSAVVQVFKGQEYVGIDDAFVETSGAKMNSFFGVNGTTGINSVTFELGNGKHTNKIVYDLNGRFVRQGTNSLNGLSHGIYIINGKKYLAK